MVFASNKAGTLAVKIVPKTYILDEDATPWAVDILAKAREAAELDAYDFEDPKRLIRVVHEKRLTGFVAVPPGIDLEKPSSLTGNFTLKGLVSFTSKKSICKILSVTG